MEVHFVPKCKPFAINRSAFITYEQIQIIFLSSYFNYAICLPSALGLKTGHFNQLSDTSFPSSFTLKVIYSLLSSLYRVIQKNFTSYIIAAFLKSKAIANRAEANGGLGGGGGAPPQETTCRKILLSCRKFCDLND